MPLLFKMPKRSTSLSTPRRTVLSGSHVNTSSIRQKFEDTEIALLRKKLAVVVSAFNTEIRKHENELKMVRCDNPAPYRYARGSDENTRSSCYNSFVATFLAATRFPRHIHSANLSSARLRWHEHMTAKSQRENTAFPLHNCNLQMSKGTTKFFSFKEML